ncbi:MlaD family protein [Flagellimonas pacifica]|uniref:Phospholipid/cholesterol/gamma-HCH transport system substrate-binding protein n=1 Tax=Flagellimonas pacifica TaxID=1247520 RepID=A0A285MSE4_9FLAO|nr:MlaD family protein [Allomuricauda parva]SNY99603.1 phospholipid/cholesterol/gamma-HCH transport system substrate-binding protein [Allomuricauda parva]
MKLSREIKTGIVVLTGILAFIFGLSYLKSSSFFENNKTLYAVYDHVGGLQPGTQVSINGLSVGNVVSIRFKDTTGKLLVTFSVSDDFEFSKNSHAEIYDTGIIGGKGIQIHPVFDDSPMVKSGDTLKSSIKPGLTALVQEKLTPLQMKVEGAVSHADSLLMNVNDVLDDQTKLELRQSIAGLNNLIGTFKSSADKLNVLLENNKEQLDSSLKNVDNITTNFSKLSDSLAGAGLAATVADFKTTVERLNKVLGQIEKGEGSLGKLANDSKLYDNLTDASKELDLLLQDFRLNPKRYVNVSVFGKKQKDYELPENDPAAQNKN